MRRSYLQSISPRKETDKSLEDDKKQTKYLQKDTQ